MPDAPAGTPDISAQVEGIVQKIFQGANWRNEVERTVRRNVKLLEKNKLLQTENDTLKAAGPKDGAKVLTKEETTMFDAFKALNLKPEDIKVIVKEHGEFKVAMDEHKEEEGFKAAAKSLEFQNVPALTRWLKREGLHLEFKDEPGRDDEGARIMKKVPVVRPKNNDKAALEPLETYITREVPEFVDTFKSAPARGEGDEEGDEIVEDGDDGEAALARVMAEAQSRVGGVRIPATRSTRTASTPSSRDKKVLERLEAEAAANPMYSV